MIKISKKTSIVGLALLAAFFLAFFPTSSFISSHYVVFAKMKQQTYDKVGQFTVSPFEAAKYYSYQPGNCYWIDIRDANQFNDSHLPNAINQPLKQLKNTQWTANDLVIIYGNNTGNAQEAAALLRQKLNARAFAVKGGFAAVKKYLMDPIGISITAKFNDTNLEKLMEVRDQLSGKNGSSKQLLEKLKSGKKKAIREGC